jgi:large subunit ribosomal protein L31
MKPNIHPNWQDDVKVTCSCGNSFTTGSAQDSIKVDLCNKCHPFFTGEMKFVDVQGRVEKFQAKQKQAQKIQAIKTKKTSKKSQQAQDPKTLKEMLTTIKKEVKDSTPAASKQ